jgi:hypothetical protein
MMHPELAVSYNQAIAGKAGNVCLTRSRKKIATSLLNYAYILIKE